MGLVATASKREAGKAQPAPKEEKTVVVPAPTPGKAVQSEPAKGSDGSEPEAQGTEPTVSLKVDGEIVEIPLSDVLKMAEKTGGADKRFEEAAELRKRYEGWDSFIENVENDPDFASHLDRSIRSYKGGQGGTFAAEDKQASEPANQGAGDSALRALVYDQTIKVESMMLASKFGITHDDAFEVMTLAKRQGLLRNTEAAYWMWKGKKEGASPAKKQTPSEIVLEAIKKSRGATALPSQTGAGHAAATIPNSGETRMQANIRRMAKEDKPMGLFNRAMAWKTR